MDAWSWNDGWGKYSWQSFKWKRGIFTGFEGWAELVEERKGDEREGAQKKEEHLIKRRGQQLEGRKYRDKFGQVEWTKQWD